MSDRDAAKIALFGAAGRMGREIAQHVGSYPRLRLAYLYDPHHEGDEIGGIQVQNPSHSLPKDVAVVIDFSAADAVLENVELAVVRRLPYVCGVTGLSAATMEVLKHSADTVPVLHSPNMSAGMNVMFRLAELTAKALPGYERHIVEVHHARKKDSPSGTALRIRDRLRDAIHEDTSVTALRMGDVTGEHQLIFGGPGERLEIIHHADSRAVFAHGALRAAEWILDRNAGYYSMGDVLGLA